eukprot:466607_1
MFSHHLSLLIDNHFSLLNHHHLSLVFYHQLSLVFYHQLSLVFYHQLSLVFYHQLSLVFSFLLCLSPTFSCVLSPTFSCVLSPTFSCVLSPTFFITFPFSSSFKPPAFAAYFSSQSLLFITTSYFILVTTLNDSYFIQITTPLAIQYYIPYDNKLLYTYISCPTNRTTTEPTPLHIISVLVSNISVDVYYLNHGNSYPFILFYSLYVVHLISKY